MKLKNILKNNATLIITIFLALTIAILSAKCMLSSNKDYLSIINNLIEEQNYDDALNKIKELQNDDSITLTDEENTSLNNHESLLKDYLKLDLIDSLTEYNTQMQLLLSNPLLENKSFTKMSISLKNYDALLQIELASFNDTKKIIFESM